MKIVATIEARMGSQRLPGKVLAQIGAWKSLELQIKRLRRSKLIDEIVLATTTNPLDEALEAFSQEQEIPCCRGSEEDVLGRILAAAQSVGGDIQVQITGDCPLIDAEIVDRVINAFLQSEPAADFVSNEIERSFPIGLDCRVFPVSLLEEIDRICDDPIHRSHGSTYIYAGPVSDRYHCINLRAPDQLLHPKWRWTLDTPEDLFFMRSLADAYGVGLLDLSSVELANWLQHNPDIIAINSSVRQKAIEDG